MDLLSIVLILFYSILFFFLFREWRGLGTSQLAPLVFSFLFVIKLVCGLANYAYFFGHSGSDAVAYTRECYTICSYLHTDPAAFWHEISYWGDYPGGFDILSRNTRFWEQLGFNIHRRVLIVLTLLSFGKPFVVACLFSLISFIGQSFLWRAFVHYQPAKKRLFLIPIFMIPTVSFWTAGIAKESYILLGLGLIVYFTIHLRSQRSSVSSWFCLIFGIILLGMVRNFFLLSLLPFYLVWVLSYRLRSRNIPRLYLGLSILFGALFLASSLLPEQSPMNVYHRFAQRQAEFLNVAKGGSSVPLESIADIRRLPKATMQALQNTLLRPYPSDIEKVSQLLAALDTYIVLILILLCAWLAPKQNLYRSFFFFMVSYSLANIVLIGLTVPNLGAISRYKSIFILLLLASFFLLPNINWEKIKDRFPVFQ